MTRIRKLHGVIMLSYYNNPELKAKVVAMAKRHYEQDMLTTQTYGEYSLGDFKGCSVGCFAHDISPTTRERHEAVADHHGLPEWLIWLSDALFEGLPKGERERFHVDLYEAIPVGVDVDPVKYRLSIARHTRQLERLADNNEPYAPEVRAALQGVIDWCSMTLDGSKSSSEAAALAAAESAAESAAALAAALAAAAESARLAAEWFAAPQLARSNEYKAERDVLLSILREMQP